MTPELHCFHLARFVLQAETAFAVNSGLRDGAFDSLIVRDANDLPAIPGTSLAGVLRQSYNALVEQGGHSGLAQTQALFGYAENDTGEASRLHISWGCVHGSDNQPVEGIGFTVDTDPLLERLQHAHAFHRERVSISDKGTAKEGSKFDLTVVPAGCRFGFEISFWSTEKEDQDWQQILSLLHCPLQLGSNTRNGLGWFQLQSLHQLSLDLKDQADWKSYQALSFSIGDRGGLSAYENNSTFVTPIHATLDLTAEDFWRFGQPGEALLSSAKAPDATPLLEPVIDWSLHPANFSVKKVVIPASGVKGALAHRVQFHFHRLQKEFIGLDANKAESEQQANLLFGMASLEQKGKDQGQAGLLFKDLYLDNTPQAAHLNHNSVDRFTGGVRDKVLYTEELIWQSRFSLVLQIDPIQLRQIETEENEEALKQYKTALKCALDDLAQGRLALGAGSAKGHGYFNGSIHWSDNGKWIGEMHD